VSDHKLASLARKKQVFFCHPEWVLPICVWMVNVNLKVLKILCLVLLRLVLRAAAEEVTRHFLWKIDSPTAKFCCQE